MVVLGNPPYSGHSANKGEWITGLVGDYKKDCPELHKPGQAKWLQDDYVKFIRFAEWRINETGEGVLGYITNHGYLDNPTFRGMRQHLMQTFDEIYVLDLHGNSKKKEKSPDGGKDENVFDIQQGVAILLAVKVKLETGDAKKAPARVFHADLWGRREIYEGEHLTGGKYDWLWQNNAETTTWREVPASAPGYLFIQQDEKKKQEYDQGWSVPTIFSENGDPAPGIVTTHDEFAIAFTREEMVAHVEALLATETEEDARSLFKLCSQSQWNYAEAKKELARGQWRKELTPILYRPFDVRWTVFNRHVAVHRRERVMRHMLAGDNRALCATRSTEIGSFEHVFSSVQIIGHHTVSLKEVNYVFPLYLHPSTDALDASSGRRPNINPEFLNALAERLTAPREGPYGLPKDVTPEDIFQYAYAVFHSPTYRTRYAEFLKLDFPRLPLTSNRDLFFSLASLGGELAGLHLMESPTLNDIITEFPEKGTDAVEKVQYTDKDKRVWINPTQYFAGVSSAVWNFHIGGYQVCEKWLKDRKGRTLTYEDIQHYQKIVVALNETIRLMAEIDQVIETQGGWPAAFSGNKI